MTRFFDLIRPQQEVPPRRPGRLGRYRYVRLRWRVLFALVDLLGMAIFGPVRWLLRVLRVDSEDPARPPQRILVVQLDHLGDAVLSLGLLRGLRSTWPAARLEVLAAPWTRELFETCGDVDQVHVCASNRFARHGRRGWLFSMLCWGWKLRARRYDLAIDVRGDFPIALLLWLSGAKCRLGWGSGGGGFLLTHRPRFIWGRHEVASRQALLDRIDIAAPQGTTAWAPRFEPSAEATRHIIRQLPALGDDQRPLVVLHVGAGTGAKRWSAERWREVLGRLIVEHDAHVALIGTAGESSFVKVVTEGKVWPSVTDWTGRLQLDELAALIERADVFIGADSGPAHLAAAVGTPVVVLFSGTNDARQWRPWGVGVTVLRNKVACAPCHQTICPLSNHPCMNGIRAADVMQAVSAALASGRTPFELDQLLPELYEFDVSLGARRQTNESPRADARRSLTL